MHDEHLCLMTQGARSIRARAAPALFIWAPMHPQNAKAITVVYRSITPKHAQVSSAHRMHRCMMGDSACCSRGTSPLALELHLCCPSATPTHPQNAKAVVHDAYLCFQPRHRKNTYSTHRMHRCMMSHSACCSGGTSPLASAPPPSAAWAAAASTARLRTSAKTVRGERQPEAMKAASLVELSTPDA